MPPNRLFTPANLIALVAVLGTILSLFALWVASDKLFGIEASQAQAIDRRPLFLAWISLGFFLLLGLAAGYIDWRQRKARRERIAGSEEQRIVQSARRSAIDKQPSADWVRGTIWLRPTEKFRKRLKLIAFLLAVLSMVGAGLIVRLAGRVSADWLLAFVIFSAVAGWIVYALFKRIGGLAIGIDEEGIQLVDLFGRRTKVKREALIYTRNRLIAGSITIPLRNNQGEIFEFSAIEQHLLPLLTEEQQTTEFGYLTGKLRRGDLKTWLGFLALLLALVAAVWLEMQN